MHNFGFNPTQFRVQPMYPGLKRILDAVRKEEKRKKVEIVKMASRKASKKMQNGVVPEQYNFVNGAEKDLVDLMSV